MTSGCELQKRYENGTVYTLCILVLHNLLNAYRDWFAYSQAKGNAILQASLERRKQALHERRLALEQDVNFLFLDNY